MRKRQLSALKEMSDLLKQAHESIRKVIAEKIITKDNLNAVFSLLSQCQSAAINMGNIIEESEGEGFVTVKYLEDYCELVYAINEELQVNSGTDNPDKVYKKLNKMLQKIDNSIAHDIPLKREAVFLPYKASMWDSLESVWEAADADPDCDAYVIPIPYFDKNPDGSVREEHYEGDLFPENVPVTHYSEYDFGKHHPDMIFIHNPYDYGNLVTTIHPFFYAENMKKVTDCLVYIPYFATSGSMGADKAWCPVYDYVDYIVIQTEEYRKFYSPDIPDEKFLPFGSPKFDKVIRKCQNPPKAPEEWLKRAEGRKVFFYNTSLACMLQNTPDYLKKIEYVFDTFRNHREYCLLWRPHPLFKSTLEAMRPKWVRNYESLLTSFRKESGWILDESSCVEDTISFCDAYIGDDASSIVALFGVAGKPIFILNNKIIDESVHDNYNRIIKMSMPRYSKYSVGTKYVISDDNVLYWAPKDDFNYKRFCYFSKYSDMVRYLHIYNYENNLVLSPATCEEIVIINPDNPESKEVYSLDKPAREGWLFQDSFIIQNKLILIPHDYNSMVIFDLQTKEISYIKEISNFIKEYQNNEEIYGSSWTFDNYIYISNPTFSRYIKIDIETLNYTVEETGLETKIRRVVTFDNKNECWLIHFEGPYITRYSLDNNCFKTYDLTVDGLKAVDWITGQESTSLFFDGLLLEGNKLYIAPLRANKIIILDIKSEEVSEYDYKVDLANDYKCRLGYFIGDKNLFYSFKNRECYKVTDDGFKECNLSFDYNQVREDLRKFKRFSPLARYCNVEKEFNSLETYLSNNSLYDHSSKMQLEVYNEVNAAENGDCGMKVYKYIIDNNQN